MKKSEENEEITILKNLWLWFLGVAILLSIVLMVGRTLFRTVETGIVRYEEYQEIYNTVQKLNSDLCNMKTMPENDKMFEQFSKPQRINTLRSQVDRWINEYNAKSKMLNRSVWKSSELPYQLSTNDCSCY